MIGSNMTTSVTPLRASCDRCRAQKLRCVPSSETDPTAPCQRCLRAKKAKSCVFSRRQRTGRCAKVSGESVTVTSPDKENECSTPPFPGMGAFALSSLSPSKRPQMNAHALASPRTSGEFAALSSDDKQVTLNSAPGETVPDISEGYSTALDQLYQITALQQTPEHLFGEVIPSPPGESNAPETVDTLTTSIENISDVDISAYLDVSDPLLSPPNLGLGMDMDIMMTTARPGPLVDLASLVTQMSQYEHQLCTLSSNELDDYPIGDALFLSQRLYSILSDCSRSPTIEPSFNLDMPTKLLILSCYMTLTRIYSIVFGQLHGHLLQLPNAHTINETHRLSSSFLTDMHAYQGLRLGQLQPICMCADREPATRAKKAVSMLLGSLAGAESVLGLPSDVRAVDSSWMDGSREPMTNPSSGREENIMLFKEGLVASLTNGRLYKSVRGQTRELRAKVEEVDELLKGLLGI